MPVILVHRCIKCGAEFKGSSEDILKGCPECGSKFFAFKKKGKPKKVDGETIETIMVKGHGVYEVNLSSMMEDESVVVSDSDGKYLIDLNYLLKKRMKEKKS